MPSRDRVAPSQAPAPEPAGRFDLVVAGLLAAAALLVYLTTVCRTLYWGDTSEFSVVCPRLDIAHPTGYPTFTMLGWLCSLVPIGSVALRVNLLGSLTGAVAAGLTYLCGREVGLSRWAAAWGAGLFALSRELWEQSTAAEVYSLHIALTAAVLLASMRLGRAPSARALVAAAGLLGLSFTNHLTTLWTIPAAAWFALCQWRPWRTRPVPWRPSRRELQVAALAFAGALALYLYLPLRSWQGVLFDHGEPRTVGNLLYHLTGRQFQYRMFVEPDAGLFKELSTFADLFKTQFTPWLLPLVVVGAGGLWMRDRKAAIGLALLAGANLAFDLNYHIPDKEGYFLPVWMTAALAAAAGLETLAAIVPLPAAARASLAVLLLAVPAASNYSEVDKSENRSLPEFTAELLKRVPEGSLMLVDDQFLIWSVNYEQLIERRYPNRIVLNDYLLCLPWYVNHLKRRYPELVLPREVDELVAERGREVARAAGWQIGDISQRYTERIARRIVQANLPSRRVFWNFHASDEKTTWQEMPLVNRGLFYEVLASRPAGPAEPWAIDYPDPAGYRKDRIRDRHHRHVADTFSVACNRAGIALIGAGRYPEAEAAFGKALAYNPEYPQVHLNLGVLFNQYLPDPKKRDEHWRKFVEMAPEDPQVANVKKALGL